MSQQRKRKNRFLAASKEQELALLAREVNGPKLCSSILESTEEWALQGLRGSFYKWGWRRESLTSPEPETVFKKLKINKLPGERKVRLPIFAVSGFQDRQQSLAAYLAGFLKPRACFTALVCSGGFIEHLTMEGSDI